jgi:hypothetical protein
VQEGSRLCISNLVQSAAQYDVASERCRQRFGHVCTYEDFFYLFTFTNFDAIKSPEGKWIGNITGDDQVLCGNTAITSANDSDIQNFEGTCNKNDSRTYFCCHDDDVD